MTRAEAVRLYEPLDRPTELALIALARGGDRAAADRLIRGAVKKIWYVAVKAARAFPHMGIDDAWCEASYGAFDCLRNHDGRGAFATLAVPYAWGQCQRAEGRYRCGVTIPAHAIRAVRLLRHGDASHAGAAASADSMRCVRLGPITAGLLEARPDPLAWAAGVDGQSPLPRDGTDVECYEALVRWVHPDGLVCPRCGSPGGFYEPPRRSGAGPVVEYDCRACGRGFTAFTGTLLGRTRHRPGEVVEFLTGLADGVPRDRLADELGWSRGAARRLYRNLRESAGRWRVNGGGKDKDGGLMCS